MKIAVVSGFSPLWGKNMTPDILVREVGKSVGGGEEAMIRTSVGLAEHGHDVTLWWCGQPGEWRGVRFKSDYAPLALELVQHQPDVIVGWSTILPFQWKGSGKDQKPALCLFAQQLNDCWSVGNWDLVDCVVSPSRNHAQQLPRWGWKGKWTVVHNGLDPELYGAGDKKNGIPPGFAWDMTATPCIQPVLPWESRPLNVGYWSSPDRGLHYLLAAWPLVTAREPTARLHIFYEIDNWLASGAARNLGAYGDRARVMVNELLPRAKADPTVTFHGQVTRKMLAKIQLQCRVMCYPFQPIEYTEGFCGSVNQGIAAGCHVLSAPHDALPSLYGNAVTWLPAETAEMVHVLPEAIVAALHKPPPAEAAAVGRRYTWDAAAVEMERAVQGHFDCNVELCPACNGSKEENRYDNEGEHLGVVPCPECKPKDGEP